MADPLDLTPFGFTQTETKMYTTLVTFGPGTGYALAQAAGLARANAYSALEGLVTKGAARVDGVRPKRYRPETGPALMARLGDRQAAALDRLELALSAIKAPDGPALVEMDTARACWQALGRDIARASERVWLCAPPDAYLSLAAVLRRAVGAVPDTILLATGPVAIDFATVTPVAIAAWPGEPVLAVVDDRVAVLGRREDGRFEAQWSASPAFVAGAALAFDQVRGSA